MSFIPLTAVVISVCCVTALLLHRYGNWRKQHMLVLLAAFVSWYFSLMIIFTLPIDVSNTVYRQCVKDREAEISTLGPPINPNNTNDNISTTVSPTVSDTEGNDSIQPFHFPPPPCKKPLSYVRPQVLLTFWHVVYWTSQFLTWLLLPIMQSYAKAGDFTVAGKLKTALIENAIYYGSYLLIFGVCLIYIAIRPDINIDGPSLKVLAITASNTWGLFLLVLLLGYGLVEVPRTCWQTSRKGHMMHYTYFRLAKLSVERSEAEEHMEDVMDDVKKAAETIKYNHPMRKHVETILDKCPSSVQETVRRRAREDYEDYNNPTETPTEKSLIRLHRSVIKSMQTYHRTQCQWNTMVEKAFELEDIQMNEQSHIKEFRRSYGNYDGIFVKCYSPSLEWYWKCLIKPWGLKIFTVLLIIFSFMVVWSECLFFIKSPVLSFFALFIELAKKEYNYMSIEFVCFLTIAYLSVCAYYTIFKIRIFNYYYLATHHQTDENSLLFCGMLLCRLTPPLCLNFLGLIHLDGHITKEGNLEETFYTQIMGHMDVISFISDGFNIYFPIAIVLLCIATYFHICTRALHCLGFQQFIGDDDMTQELTDEGKNLVSREKRKRQRQEDGEARRREWNERFITRSQQREAESEIGRRSSEYGSTKHRKNTNKDTVEMETVATSKVDKKNEKKKKKEKKGGANSSAKHDKNVDPNSLSVPDDGRYLAPRSPQEHDTAELLKEVESIDYTTYDSGMGDGRIDDDPFKDEDEVPRRSSSQYTARPTRPTSFGSRFQKTNAPAKPGPPKNIFDDV